MKRILVDDAGNTLGTIEHGDHKALSNQRVKMAPGDPTQVAVVRRIFEEYAAGTSVAAAALKLSVTPETIRAHLKSVYAKTGVHRQIDLARLLSERP